MGITQEEKTVTVSPGRHPSEKLFLTMANAAPVLIWLSGTDRHFSFFNKTWLDFTGRTKEQEQGNGWLDGVHMDDRERCIGVYLDSFDKQQEFEVEYRLRRQDGKYRWMLENGVPYYDDNKIFSGFIGSCVDVSEIKEQEKRKDQFITTASHELKTPLTSLQVYLHLISEYLNENDDNKYAGYAKNAVMQAKKLTDLINQLLDLSRIQADSLNFQWSVFSFKKSVTDIVQKIQLTTSSHKIEITGNCDAMVRGDQERLSHAMENLLTNAIKFSKDKDKILVKLSQDTKNVYVSVIDFGIGIDNNDLSQIFHRFYRVSGATEETFPGMGIGLYLSKQIIERHGGKISVESIKNKETKFNFQIPLLLNLIN
ncbi:MAG TPA: PAS domain-containing sensor histidine kinase [Hanamia sp.]|nr:PAS domain-containing sensor histidine kinase [Hanamia sp.]